MNSVPKLSIIIPVYNAERYLSVCIDSVLSQVFVDFELILVNDGSIDRSFEICKYYEQKDDRVRVIDQKNQGQSGARNVGLKVAKGKFIGFCDNDDLLHPDMFKILMDNALSYDTDISACSYNTKDSNGNIDHDVHTGEKFCFSNKEGMREYLSRKKMDIYVWTKIYSKVFLEKYDIHFELGRNDEDFLFNHTAFLYANRSVFEDLALYTYNVREESECRIFYKKDMRKYLHNTLYRTYRIETVTREKYPEMIFFAKRQTIFYNLIMLARICSQTYQNCEPYFSYIMRYQKQNKRQIIEERQYYGMSLLGVCIMVILPSRLYYLYRHLLFKVRGR